MALIRRLLKVIEVDASLVTRNLRPHSVGSPAVTSRKSVTELLS
jgi:hypothetical protein